MTAPRCGRCREIIGDGCVCPGAPKRKPYGITRNTVRAVMGPQDKRKLWVRALYPRQEAAAE